MLIAWKECTNMIRRGLLVTSYKEENLFLFKIKTKVLKNCLLNDATLKKIYKKDRGYKSMK